MFVLIDKSGMSHGRWWLVLFCFFWTIAAEAQSTDRKLTLNDAISAGIANSKLLKSSGEKIAIAQEKLGENNTQYYPRFNVSSSYSRLSNNITPFTVKFPGAPSAIALNPQILNQYGENAGSTELIYSGGKVKNTAKALNFLIEAAKQDYANDRSTVIYNTINAYYSLYILQKAAEILQQNAVLLQARVNDLQNLEQFGTALHNDVLKIQIQLSQLKVQQIDNQNSIENTRFAFNILLGLPDTAKVNLDTTSFFSYKLDKTYTEYEKLALSSRPDLQSATFRTESAKANVDVVRAGYLPSIVTAANYNYLRPNARLFPNQDIFTGTWNIGLTLSWDISSLYNNRHYVKDAKENYEQTRQTQLSTYDNVRIDVYNNYLAYKYALEHVKLSKLNLDQTSENYRIVNDRLQAKIVVSTDLQDATNSLIQSQLALLEDEANADLAYFKLIKSTGTLSN